MTLRKIAFSLISGLALVGLLSVGASAADVRLKLAGTYPIAHFGHPIMEEMVKDIEAADVGLKVSYFPANQLGSGEELIEDAMRGNVDIVQAFLYAQADPRLEVGSLPGLASTFDEVAELYGNPDSTFNKIVGEIMADLGLVYLANAGEGPVGIVANEKPTDYAGFGEKGVNIRVWSSEVVKKTTEALGYRTTTMNFGEVVPALQAGVIDGAHCCTPEWSYTLFAAAEIGQYFIPVNLFNEATALYASAETWEKLTQPQRDAVRSASLKAANTVIAQARQSEQDFLKQLQEAGWEILEYTPEQRAAMVSYIQENIWPELADIVGQDIIDQLIAS